MIVGIDMGGTHIDGAIIKDGKIIKTIKNETDKDDIFNTILSALIKLLDGVDKSLISRINLSTTISTNAIVEDKVSKVGMVISSGPGRVYNFDDTNSQVHFISGYSDHKGDLVKSVNKDEVLLIKDSFKENKVEAVGVVSKFSVRNPNFELEVSKLLKDDFNDLTMGHSLSGKLNFSRRVKTTYLNAAVKKTFLSFAQNLERSLSQENITAPVYILKADGGTMTISEAVNKPVETILSGPAASFMGVSAMYDEVEDGILLDIGGTTTDIFFLIKGEPLFEPLGITINQHQTLIRAIFSDSIGLGGDSYVRIENKELKIGPQRKGKPIIFGGSDLTPTDAMAALDLIDGDNKEAALKSLSLLGESLNLSVVDVSNKILDVFVKTILERVTLLLDKINSKPVYTIKELLRNYKLEPKFINVIGGPAEMMAPKISKQFDLEVKYPKNYSVANAIGASLAKPTFEINMHVDTYKQFISIPEVNIYNKVSRSYNLKKAKSYAIEVIENQALSIGEDIEDVEAEIVEASSFNMLKGYMGASKNIRVRAQSKPGLIYKLKGDY